VSIAHLLTAVIMTAPATLMLAKMFVPETGNPLTRGIVSIEVERQGVNVIDAAARGAYDGLYLALNIAGMLIAFLALIAMMNGGLAWALGVSWNDCATVGNLLGTRMILNEFVAFVDLGKVGSLLQPRSFVIATFALCGFANLGSIAIQIGG